ncbi:hypothetical protein [Streptomyces sp. SID3343]|nr:hypothetical protein [Streptomyces sp. SID3343]MYV97596.1 hypothetical protein [Streptomyces sp. SID3343]
MTEPTPEDVPAEHEDTALEPDTEEHEVVLHAAGGDDGETPWCIGDMTAY